MKKLLLSAFLILMCSEVSAVPVSLTNPYLFRISTGPNSVNYPTYDTIALGVYAEPTTGTSVVGRLGGTGTPVTLTLVGDVVGPNEYARLLTYNTARTSAWTITATNGADSSQVVTHSIFGVAALPFVENVSLNSSTGILTPTISWTIPDTAINADAVRVGIYDDVTNQRIYHGSNMPITTTSFTVPNGLLSTGGSYAIRVFLDDKDTDGSTLSRSQTFVNFTPVATTQPVILPSLTTDSDPNDNLGAPFLFNCSVKAGETVLIDPVIAIGYEYKIGKNDPNFATVTLPILGDNKYELWLFNGTDFVFTKHLKGGTTHSFGDNGVASFRILGIEDSLNIDPANATAFITGLTFVSDGKFTGSMTPIINLPEIAGDWSVDDIETLSAKGLGEETKTTNGIVRFSFAEANSGTIELDFGSGDSTNVTYTGPFTLNKEGTKITWSLDTISLQDYQAYLREWFADLALATGQISDESDVSDFQLTKATFKPISVSKKSQSPVDMTIKTTGIATGIFGGKPITIKFSHNGMITFIGKNP